MVKIYGCRLLKKALKGRLNTLDDFVYEINLLHDKKKLTKTQGRIIRSLLNGTFDAELLRWVNPRKANPRKERLQKRFGFGAETFEADTKIRYIPKYKVGDSLRRRAFGVLTIIEVDEGAGQYRWTWSGDNRPKLNNPIRIRELDNNIDYVLDYKVGDKVKIIDNDVIEKYHQFDIGEIVTLVKKYDYDDDLHIPDDWEMVNAKGISQTISFGDFELVKEKKYIPKYKVGDILNLKTHKKGLDRIEIIELQHHGKYEDYYHYKFLDGGGQGIFIDSPFEELDSNKNYELYISPKTNPRKARLQKRFGFGAELIRQKGLPKNITLNRDGWETLIQGQDVADYFSYVLDDLWRAKDFTEYPFKRHDQFDEFGWNVYGDYMVLVWKCRPTHYSERKDEWILENRFDGYYDGIIKLLGDGNFEVLYETFENYPNSKKIEIIRGDLIDKLINVMLPEIKYHPREKMLKKRFNINSPIQIITEDRDNMLYLYVGIEGELGYIGNVDAKGNFEYVSRLAAGKVFGYYAVKDKYPSVSNFLSANYEKVMTQKKIDAFNKNPNQWLEIKSADESLNYKVGDKVKVVYKVSDDDPTPLGTIFTISEVHERGCFMEDNEYSNEFWLWSEIEMVEKVGFKIGDKAKVVGPINDDEFEDGEIVTIIALKSDERVMATNDEGRTILMAWSELEKYTPPKSFNPRKARLQKRFGFGADNYRENRIRQRFGLPKLLKIGGKWPYERGIMRDWYVIFEEVNNPKTNVTYYGFTGKGKIHLIHPVWDCGCGKKDCEVCNYITPHYWKYCDGASDKKQFTGQLYRAKKFEMDCGGIEKITRIDKVHPILEKRGKLCKVCDRNTEQYGRIDWGAENIEKYVAWQTPMASSFGWRLSKHHIIGEGNKTLCGREIGYDSFTGAIKPNSLCKRCEKTDNKSAETFEAEGMMLWKGKSIPISEFDYSKVPNGWTVDEYSEYGGYTNEELVILLDNPSKSPQTVITDIEDYDKRDCPRHKYGMGSHFTKRNNGVRRYIMDGCECIIYDNSTMKSRKKRVSKLRREHSNQNILPVESETTNKVLVVGGIIAGLIGLNKLFSNK